MSNKQCIKLNSPKIPPIIPTYTGSNIRPAFLKKYHYLLLTSLNGVHQNLRYHPESDALYHSLQVFQHAHKACSDPELWAAALLHDIGKAVSASNHAEIGAQKLEGLLSSRVVWLVRHHLHLLIAPKRTRRWLHNTPQLNDLELLRNWDLNGRSPYATVITPFDAIDILMQHFSALQFRSNMAYYYENKEL